MQLWLLTPLLVAVAVAATTAPRGAQLLQADTKAAHRRRSTGMPPCKRCSAARLHSRDDLLAMDDGTLLKMKGDISQQVEDLGTELDEMEKKQGAVLGKLNKRLNDMGVAYKKFGEDTVARTTKLTNTKAKASKKLDGSLDSTLKVHTEIAGLSASMTKMRSFLNPYVDKLISGKGWPHGCKFTAKAKALLQQLQATLNLANIDVSDVSATKKQALLRRSAKSSKPASQEKYKLVRLVSQLEEKRAKMMQEKTAAISGFSSKQRITLDRIDTARVKANLKKNTEQKYVDIDADLKQNLKKQMEAADSYSSTAKTQLARLKKNDGAALKLFKSFSAELKKCKCL